MSNQPTQTAMQAIADALHQERFEQAFELAGDLAQTEPDLADVQQLYGVAATRWGRLEVAGEAFRKAYLLRPREPKHIYNLAINLRDRELTEESAAMAALALALDPRHQGAKLLQQEVGVAAPAELLPIYAGHYVPALEGLDKVWLRIGYLVLAMSAALAILMLVHLPMGPTGALMGKERIPEIALRKDGLSIFVTYLYILSAICTFMWMFIDIIDRRQRFSWMVPLIACGVLGFNALPLCLYMFLGRNIGATSPAAS